MINLCLDTNVYLSFYHFSNNDLQKLEEILNLIENDELNVILPEQIKNEFTRNRETKISDALRVIKELKIDFKLPRILDSYEEKKELKEIFKSYSEKKNELVRKAENDINNNSLKADILIQKIFKNAELIHLSDEIWNKAKKRFDLWNPPWKDRSYWDAVIWESLLKYKKWDEDIYFVSIDRDFSCSLDPSNLDNFLKKEWDNREWFLPPQWKFYFFNDLNNFFQNKFLDIKLNEEYFKNKTISNLEESSSFDRTRAILLKLTKYENFSLDQINRIIDAAISNNQIYWAKDYTPWIAEALQKLIVPYLNKISPSKKAEFLDVYDPDWYEEMMNEEYFAIQQNEPTNI